jgi:hypothetical protein
MFKVNINEKDKEFIIISQCSSQRILWPYAPWGVQSMCLRHRVFFSFFIIFKNLNKKLIKFIIDFTLKIKFTMRNDGHFGQFNTFSKKANKFGWNMLRSTMFQVFFRKIHPIPTMKKYFYFLIFKSTKTLFCQEKKHPVLWIKMWSLRNV